MEKFLTCEEVAEVCRVKVTTVWAWIREGKLKAFRLGRDYRVKKEDLDAFIETAV